MRLFLIISSTIIAAIAYRIMLAVVFIYMIVTPFNAAEKKSVRLVPEQQTVTKERGWALGCAAMLTERNHSRHDVLATNDLTPQSVQSNKKLLADWWGVHNRAEFLDALVWLDEQGGHRKSFEKTGQEVSDMSHSEFKSALAACGTDMEKKQKLTIAKQYYTVLGDKGLKGWDYTRYVALCRWGYTSGYITEDEAWAKIMPVARKLQKTFDSWEDLGQNYLIGRQFWSYQQTQSSGFLFTDAYNRLMQNKDSPWNMYPWDMDLSSQQDETDADD
jgi:hypothetical protein